MPKPRKNRHTPSYRSPRHRRRRTVRHSHSAGGVAYRVLTDVENTQPCVQIALIATSSGERWQLPKGRLEPGEESEDAAVREVQEETGLLTVCEAFLKTVEYRYVDTYKRQVPELVIKKVDFYLLRVVGGELNDQSIEVDGVAWHSPHDAFDQLTFESEQECIALAQEHWK